MVVPPILCLIATALGQSFEDGLAPSPAYAMLRQGDARAAIRALRAAPDSPEVRKTLAAAYYAEKQFTLFAAMMRSVIAERPDDFAPYYYLGRHSDTDLRDFRTAASYFESAVERYPAHAPSLYYLGFAREQLGEFEASAAAYQRARALRRDYALPLLGLARLRLTGGAVGEAVTLAREAIRLAPSNPAFYAVLARALSATGRKNDAAAAWQRVAALDPTDAAARYHLYRFYLESGDKARAEQAKSEFEQLRAIYGVE
ncbi:MAG: tetratricopeptide repeat protein [Bryobacteraceae bacterium]|nr:tetratricopeptide repeat protein [Bryobacteraceae bacterium]